MSAITRGAIGPRVSSRRRPGIVVERPVLDPPQCDALIRCVDEFHARVLTAHAPAAADLKIPLSLDTVAQLVGLDAVCLMHETLRLVFAESLPGSQHGPPKFVLRRRAGGHDANARIAFHRDMPRVVLNVALNADFLGGRLLLAHGARIVEPARRVGSGIAHDNAVVHGVTRITAGVRYSLLACLDLA